MDDHFEIIGNKFDLLSINPSKYYLDLQQDIEWTKCIKAIENIKKDCEIFSILEEYYIEKYRCYLRTLLEELWNHFEENAEIYKKNPKQQHEFIFEIIKNLNNSVSNWIKNPLLNIMFGKKSEKLISFQQKLLHLLYTAMMAGMPLLFSSFLFNTFAYSLEVMELIIKIDDFSVNSNEVNRCCICNKKTARDSRCYCLSLSHDFIKFISDLRKMGIFFLLCDDIVKNVLYNAIEKRISTFCKGKNFNKSCLLWVFSWFQKNAVSWLRIIYTPNEKMNLIENLKANKLTEVVDIEPKNSNPEFTNIDKFHSNLVEQKVFKQIKNLSVISIKNFIVNTYICCRMKQLFDIVVDFPYSEPVLDDLHECIKFEPIYREKFTNCLKFAFASRLLHAGVPTCEIIASYITTIKALKLLDPQGSILQIVGEPIRNYLRVREDTVRCIITILANDNLTNLENSKNANLKDNLFENEFVIDAWNTWEPQKHGLSKMSKEMINSDVISMLINIFDSKDLFVQEYQRFLAQKLTLSSEINLETERKNLEILSLRFGESDLHNCEVMLKDLEDSDIINNRVHSEEFEEDLSKDFHLNGMILSAQFWPENLGFTSNEFKNFKLPDEINEVFESYKKAFEKVKSNRTLNWIHKLGTVKLEIEFKNGQQEYTVRPIQAAIIYLFRKRKIWKISELGQELNILPSVLRKNLYYWKNIGVLKINNSQEDCFEINEDGPPPSLVKHFQQTNRLSLNSQDLEMFADEEEVNNKEQKNGNDLEIFWNFIDNMLRNLQALTLDRIYSMLKLFHKQSPEIENLSMHELRQFLETKVLEKKLIFSNGVYDLNPEKEES